MAGFLFQWIRGVFKTRGFNRQRKPRSPKPSRRDTYLFLEQLEDRRLFSMNVWMPQRLNAVDGIGQNSLALQMFQPATGNNQSSQQGLSSGSIGLGGSISLVDTGVYTLSVKESNPGMAGSFTFTEAGPVTFSLSEQGSLSGSGYAVSSVVLTQTVSLAWTYVQTSGGMTMVNQSGTDSFALTSTGTGTLDAMFWQGMSWYDPTEHVIGSHSALNMVALSASLVTVNETGGSESYTFALSSGLQTISGSGNQPPADLQQTGTQSYSSTQATSFPFNNHGSNTFTLTELGSLSGGTYSFSSVNYSETGGNSFALSETTTASSTGTANTSGMQSFSASHAYLHDTSSQSYQLTGNSTAAYSESGSGAYSFSAAGSYSGTGFNLVQTYGNTGPGTYALTQTVLQTQTGTMSDSSNDSSTGSWSVGGTLTNGDTATQGGTFTQTSTTTATESGTGLFTVSEQGGYNHGSFALTTFTMTQTASSSFTFQESDTFSQSGLATVTQNGSAVDSYALGYNALSTTGAVDTQSSTETESYAFTMTSSDAISQSGSSSYSLSETSSGQARVIISPATC